MHKKRFSAEMTKTEIIAGLCFLPFYLVLLSLGLEFLLNTLLRRTPTPEELNASFYGINILFVLLAFRRFLAGNLRCTRWKTTLRTVPLALIIYFFASFMVNLVVLSLRPDFANQNNDAILGMLQGSPIFVVILSVILAPIIEETLFRGLIFGNIHRWNRFLAYAVTALGFAAIHVVSYLSILSPVDILLSVLQYIPAAVVLCAAYEMTDSLVTPILLHAVINLIACLVMGMAY